MSSKRSRQQDREREAAVSLSTTPYSPLTPLLEPNALLLITSQHLHSPLKDPILLPPSHTSKIQPRNALHAHTDRLHPAPLLHIDLQNPTQHGILSRRLPLCSASFQWMQIVLPRRPNQCYTPVGQFSSTGTRYRKRDLLSYPTLRFISVTHHPGT